MMQLVNMLLLVLMLVLVQMMVVVLRQQLHRCANSLLLVLQRLVLSGMVMVHVVVMVVQRWVWLRWGVIVEPIGVVLEAVVVHVMRT